MPPGHRLPPSSAMRSALAGILAFLLQPEAIHALPSAADARAPGPAIDRVLQAEVSNGFSGAVLVARGSSLITDKAYGTERRTLLTTETRFWIASVGKQFTSAAILKCREQGLLRLDDPIARFFPGASADKRPITVRQLLVHLSGLGQSYVSEGAVDRQTAVDRMLSEPLVDAPGQGFHYSNSNYQLAVAIVEVVSGRPYRMFVRDELWRRAGLRDSGFCGEDGARLVALARGDTPPRLSKATWGGEGVFSTTHDLLRWYRALSSGRVLSPASVKELFAPVCSIQEGQAALGWFIGRTGKDTWVSTRGNEDFGANALLYAHPDSDTVVIILTHAGDASDKQSWSRRVLAKIEKILGP